MSADVLNSTHSYDEAQLESRKADQTNLKPGAAIGGFLPLLSNKQYKAMHQKVLILLYMSNLFFFFLEIFCAISICMKQLLQAKKKSKGNICRNTSLKKKIMAKN